uniref:Uncharacterized protein n=1 Tax=Arundo donax TaxID=35708 RepID=A0A0A9CBM4_ARUDO
MALDAATDPVDLEPGSTNLRYVLGAGGAQSGDHIGSGG